jgi:myo-inositol-1(or 4)-monophosphatase
MKEIIKKHYPSHEFFAEEEHDSFPENEDVWIADPISGTISLIEGLPYYAIVVAYAKNKVIQFSSIYVPAVDELFVAYRGKGAFLNGKKISVSKREGNPKVIFALSYDWKDRKSAEEMQKKLKQFDFLIDKLDKRSHAINCSLVACGRYDGLIGFGKDSFPYFAGALLIQEAGGIFTNRKGDSNIHHGDRVFIGGNKIAYEKLKELVNWVKFP